jgi:hypothetical protein
MIKKLVIGLLSLGVMAIGAFAANNASDNASNAVYSGGGDFNTLNGGSGFGPWAEANFNGAGGGFSGTYVGASGDGNPSFGLFASATGDSGSTADSTVTMTRPFTGGALGAGQTFSISLGANSVAKGSVGINFLNGASATVFTLIGTAGTADWQLNDGTSNFDAGAAYAANTPVTFTFKFNGGSSYSFTLTGSAGGNNFTATNTISDIESVKLFDSGTGAGNNAGFNNLSITTAVPEPGTIISFLSGSSVLGAFMFIRRRRA